MPYALCPMPYALCPIDITWHSKLFPVFVVVAIAKSVIKIHITGSKYLLWGRFYLIRWLGGMLYQKYNRG